MSWIHEWREDLDTLVEIARHEIGRTDEMQRLSVALTVGEAVDTRMLEESTEHRTHTNVLGQAGHTGPQTTDPAHHEIDARTLLARRVQLVDHVGIGDRVDLDRDVTAFALLAFVANELGEPRAKVMRCNEQTSVFDVARIAGEVIEQLSGIRRHVGFAREVTEVFVHASRSGVVVAGAEMHVAAQSVFVFAHDQHAFGVSLQTDDSVHHVHTSALERLGPGDVDRLVETRLQLHQNGDLNAALGSPDEMTCDGAVTARSIERHLDALHSWIIGGLREELLHRTGKTLVRVMHQ